MKITIFAPKIVGVEQFRGPKVPCFIGKK